MRYIDPMRFVSVKYTHDLLKDAGNLGGKKARTPLVDGYKVPREGETEDSPPFQDAKL